MTHVIWGCFGLIVAAVVIVVGSGIIITREMKDAPDGKEIPGVGFVRTAKR